jgi:hypothetical protein
VWSESSSEGDEEVEVDQPEESQLEPSCDTISDSSVSGEPPTKDEDSIPLERFAQPSTPTLDHERPYDDSWDDSPGIWDVLPEYYSDENDEAAGSPFPVAAEKDRPADEENAFKEAGEGNEADKAHESRSPVPAAEETEEDEFIPLERFPRPPTPSLDHNLPDDWNFEAPQEVWDAIPDYYSDDEDPEETGPRFITVPAPISEDPRSPHRVKEDRRSRLRDELVIVDDGDDTQEEER